MTSAPSIGFVGFGEAAFHLATGLRSAGVCRLFAFDINSRTPGLCEIILQRIKTSEVHLLDSPQSLAEASEIVFSTVTSNRAVEAAEQTAPVLQPRQIYADLNSVSPSTKQHIDSIVRNAGGRFVEAAVMAPVPPYGHRVPMLLGGEAAGEFAERLSPCGMQLEVLTEPVGAAIAVKMCRSIVVKGVEALLFECMMAANHYQADARVFASLDESYPGMNWEKLATYMMGRVVEHGERRAREMEEVAETLRSAGIDPIMAEAASRRQDWGGKLNLRDWFRKAKPQSYLEILNAMNESAEDKA